MTTLALGLEAIKVLSGVQLRVALLADVLHIHPRHCYRVLEDLKALGLPLKSEKRSKEVWWWVASADARRWLATLSDPGGTLPKPKKGKG